MTSTESTTAHETLSKMQALSSALKLRREKSHKLILDFEQIYRVEVIEFNNAIRAKTPMREAYNLFLDLLNGLSARWKILAKIISGSSLIEKANLMQNDNDELEELLDDFIRHLRREEKEDLLKLLEALDAIERIRDRLNRQRNMTNKLQTRCRNIQALLDDFYTMFRVHLIEVYDVNAMTDDTLIGQYPPFETTKVILREDNNSTDDIVVTRILEHGYMWGNKLLRKANVIVKTNERPAIGSQGRNG